MGDVVDFLHDSHVKDQPRARKVAELAGLQGGVVSRRQLHELGFGRGAIAHWLSSGRLHRVHTGVYSVGHRVLGNTGRLTAAVLASGPSAVVSHRSAADWWRIRSTSRRPVDITVPGRSRGRRPGIDLHLVRALDPLDVTTRDGIPVTTLERALLDLAEVAPKHHVARAIEESERLRLFNLTKLEELLSRSPGRRGQKPLRAILTDAVLEPRSRSDLESDFLQFCHDRDIPKPVVNTLVEGFEVDMAWPDQRLIVELDGYETHGTRRAFEGDRRRDATLQLAGQRTIRVTHRWLSREPDDLERTVKALLSYARP
jgi:very-short-patch-repair endonuclease